MIHTTIPPYVDVILTAGMTNARGHQIFGVFASEEDARSVDADKLAIATLSANVLTPEQIEIAEKNTASISG